MSFNGWQLRTADADDHGNLLSLVSKHFVPHSTLHQAVGITANDFYGLMKDRWQDYLADPPVDPLVAENIDGSEMLGCLICTPFPSDFSSIDQLPGNSQSIARLLQALEHQYTSSVAEVERSVMVDLAVVLQSAAGNGIYQQMRHEIHKRARQAGYTRIFGALSSAVSQHVCVEKLGQTVVAEIAYADYSHNNTTPFNAIQEPRTIQLVSASLR